MKRTSAAIIIPAAISNDRLIWRCAQSILHVRRRRQARDIDIDREQPAGCRLLRELLGRETGPSRSNVQRTQVRPTERWLSDVGARKTDLAQLHPSWRVLLDAPTVEKRNPN